MLLFPTGKNCTVLAHLALTIFYPSSSPLTLLHVDSTWEFPELWSHYNWARSDDQTIRAFPLSNWTEIDLWNYILHRRITLAPLYYAKKRPVAETDDGLIVVGKKGRLARFSDLHVTMKMVRFRTLGCWPVTCAVESSAQSTLEVVAEVLGQQTSERQGRVSDAGSLVSQKRNGYFLRWSGFYPR